MRVLLVCVLLFVTACSPRASEPVHDVVVRGSSPYGQLRLTLVGYPSDAQYAAIGVWLLEDDAEDELGPLALEGGFFGTPAPGDPETPDGFPVLPDIEAPMHLVDAIGAQPTSPGWHAWVTEPLFLEPRHRPWFAATVRQTAPRLNPPSFRTIGFPVQWFGLRDWEWCEPDRAEPGEWECGSLEQAYFDKRLSCFYATGEPTDCEYRAADGAREILVPHVVIRTWSEGEVPGRCAISECWGIEDELAEVAPW